MVKVEHFNNRNQLAVVTGASSGIGYELAVQFAQHGYDLAVVAEDDGIEEAANELATFGTEVHSFQYDLSRHRGVEDFFDALLDLGRPVAVAAINAGVGVGGKFIETSLEEEMNLINLNVMSTAHLAKLIVQDMVDHREGGKILFTSSIAATMPGPYETVYAASKAFIQSFSLGLRYELEEFGITVTALQPGATETNFFHRAHMDDTKVGAAEKDSPAEVAKQGYEALMEGKDAIIAGSFKTRWGNAANDLIPESTKAGMHADAAKPGSAAGARAKKAMAAKTSGKKKNS